MKYTRFRDIPPLTREAQYQASQPWNTIEQWLADLPGLDLSPDFQRGHVWTEAQQTAYVEFRLRGGATGRELQFNQPGWMSDWQGPMEIVDGLQRLTAVRRFLANEIPVFGSLYREYTDTLRWMNHSMDFIVCVNNLKTRAEVLQWYLEMNAGGTPHTPEEIERVRGLLRAELST